MPSVAASGSQTATLDTDHTLATQTAPTGGAAYLLRVDAANLANGERLILTLATKARVGDTTRTAYQSVYLHAQADPLKISPTIVVEESNEVVAVLRQEGGTGRAYPWALVNVR